MRVLRKFLLVVSGLLLVLLATLSFIVGTETCSRFLITKVLPETVRIGSIDGRLIGPLVVYQVHIDAPGIALEIDRAELEWRPGRLVRGWLQIDRLTADGVDVTLVPGNTEAP